MTSDDVWPYQPEVIVSPMLTYLQPHPLEEDGLQQVAFAVGSQQAICSAGGQQGERLFNGGALSIGCLGEGSSFLWDVLSWLIGDGFMCSILSLREIIRVKLTQKDVATRKRTHGA